MSSKKYGLIVPDRSKPVFQASRNVFGNDSDSEEESKKKPILLRPSDITTRQAKISQEKAVLEDPTVYQYDEIYDDMVSKKEVKAKPKEERKPQYIENLMKAASKRKIENERRLERQIQKEREEEGDEFKDKEVFVTSAYKKKLEDMRLEEEREKREEYLESIGDVTKQKDLDGFYRHLYEQKLGKSEVSNKDDTLKKQSEKEDDHTAPDSLIAVSDTQKKRNYRKRKSSDRKSSLSDGELEKSDEEINRINLDDIKKAKKCKEDNIDADSDFSIDESSDEEREKKGEHFKKPEVTISEQRKDKPISNTPQENESKSDNKTISSEAKSEPELPKVKIDIWKKRTVGAVFEEALQRYYQRKAARGC